MDYTKLKQSYESLWERFPDNVESDLNMVWEELERDGTAFLPFVESAIEYNPSAVALFVFNNPGHFESAVERILAKVRTMIEDLPQEDEECKPKAVALWETLVLVWNEDSEEKVVAYLEKLHRRFATFPEDIYWKEKKRLINEAVDDFLLPMIEKKPPFPSTDAYIRTLFFLTNVLDEANLTGKEVHYDNTLYMDRINAFTENLTKRYVDFLIEQKYHRACSSFLHKTENLDYIKIFGCSDEEFWVRMLRTGSEHLAECLLRVKGYLTTEGLKEWKDIIYRHVERMDCIAWCDWRYYLANLVNLLDDEAITEEDFFLALQNNMPCSEYPWETTSNIKRVVGNLQFIFSEFFRRDWDVLPVLRQWNENSLYHYARRRTIYTKHGANLQFLDKSRKHDWEYNYKRFLEHSYTAQERVFIYMNTPLRLAVEFRDFVAEIAKQAGNDRIQELFDDYRLDGFLSYTDRLSPARGRMRFELDARYICTKYYYHNWNVEKNADYYMSLLFLEEDWYRSNEEDVMTMKRDSRATFKLWGYGALGKHEGVVLIHDVKDFVVYPIDPRTEMNKILDWIRKTKEEGKFIPIEKDEFPYVYPLYKLGLSEVFATEILETVNVLRKSPEDVMRFIGMINHGRVDKINEFQYILTQNEVRKFYVKDFEPFKARVKQIARNICNEPSLTTQQKMNIYMNTCLKTYFSLPLFWNYVKATENDMISYAWRNNDFDHFLFLTVYQGTEGNDGVFALAPKVYYQLSRSKDDFFSWKWQGQTLPKEKIGEYFRVSIRNIDTDKKIIWIGEVHPREIEDKWSTLIRNLMDLKMEPSLTYVDGVGKEVEALNMNYFVKNRVVQLANVFQTLFDRSGREEFTEEYNLLWCTQILTVFGEGKNPFAQRQRFESLHTLTEKERARIEEGCAQFLSDRAEELAKKPGSFTMREMEEFFEISPYNLVYTKEEFVQKAEEAFEKPREDDE